MPIKLACGFANGTSPNRLQRLGIAARNSKHLAKSLRIKAILVQLIGWSKFSDHCPVSVGNALQMPAYGI